MDNEQPLADAAPHEVEAHRNALGEMLQKLQDQGLTVSSSMIAFARSHHKKVEERRR